MVHFKLSLHLGSATPGQPPLSVHSTPGRFLLQDLSPRVRHCVASAQGDYQGLSFSVAKFDRFEDLEDQVMDHPASVTDLKVFECSIDFLQTATQTYLEDPIWDRLQECMAYTVVFKDSRVTLSSQEQLDGCPIHQVPLAVHVPMNPEEIVPEGAFAGVPRLFFFHEYGRRVGMVPRSSLKEGKSSQMVEKRTKTPKPTQNQAPKPAGRNSTIL